MYFDLTGYYLMLHLSLDVASLYSEHQLRCSEGNLVAELCFGETLGAMESGNYLVWFHVLLKPRSQA